MFNVALIDCVASSFFCHRKQLACGKWTCDVELEKPELLHTAPLMFCDVSHFKVSAVSRVKTMICKYGLSNNPFRMCSSNLLLSDRSDFFLLFFFIFVCVSCIRSYTPSSFPPPSSPPPPRFPIYLLIYHVENKEENEAKEQTASVNYLCGCDLCVWMCFKCCGFEEANHAS